MAGEGLDEVDRKILELLTENSRRTMADIGSRVRLSASSVTRRIDRLERSGVIAGYTIVVDPGLSSRRMRAFTEVELGAGASVGDLVQETARLPESEAVYRTSGPADALVCWRFDGLPQLGQVLDRLRAGLAISATRTLVVLDTWEPEHPEPRPPASSVQPAAARAASRRSTKAT